MEKKEVALTAAFTAAVTTFITGIPFDFISESITFPWAHETAFGQHIMEKTSQVLVPMFNEVGSWFGITPYGEKMPNLDVVSL